MKKRIFGALLGVVFALTLIGSTPAQAQVRVGVVVGGGPIYGHRAYPRPYYAPRAYVAPRYIPPRYVPGPYAYGWASAYDYPARYWEPYRPLYPRRVYIAPRPYFVPRHFTFVVRP